MQSTIQTFLALVLHQQDQRIYVPRIAELKGGVFYQKPPVLDYILKYALWEQK